MYYASFEPESNDVVRVWAKLQEQEDPSTKEVHGALLLGMHRGGPWGTVVRYAQRRSMGHCC